MNAIAERGQVFDFFDDEDLAVDRESPSSRSWRSMRLRGGTERPSASPISSCVSGKR